MTKILLQGYLLGLAYVAPLGMQNSYIINTASRTSRKRIFRIAIIASIMDVLLAMACFYGVGLMLERVEFLKVAMLGIGSAAVLFIGLKLMLEKGVSIDEGRPPQSIGKLAWMLFAVTWLNPQAILDGTLLLGGFKAFLLPVESPFFMIGVATASISWFFGLTYGTYYLRRFFTPRVFKMVNIACGSMLVFFGVRLGMEFINVVI
jgi:L-lysine exporter family protein LysE/ArgO